MMLRWHLAFSPLTCWMLTNSVALAGAPADMCTNTNISSFHLLTCRKYDSTASGLNVRVSLSTMNRARICASVNNR